MNLHFYAIAERDLKLISQLYVSVFSSPPWNECWQYDWAYERSSWIYRSQSFLGFVAKDNNNKTIGAILGYGVPFKGKQGHQIVDFFIDTNYQNKGIGSKLLLHLESELKQNNYDFISLLTSKNTAIEAWYKKHNYQRDNKLVLLRQEI